MTKFVLAILEVSSKHHRLPQSAGGVADKSQMSDHLFSRKGDAFHLTFFGQPADAQPGKMEVKWTNRGNILVKKSLSVHKVPNNG